MARGGKGTQPETYKIINPFKAYTEARGWRWLNIHGNVFTDTLPDKLLIHPEYPQKLVETKIRKGNSFHLSANQKRDWIKKEWVLKGLEFWVIAHTDLRDNRIACERMYAKLFEKPNSKYLISKHLYKYIW